MSVNGHIPLGVYFQFFFPGNSSVWYGFIDIIFTSPYPIDETQEQTATSTVEDIPAIATAVEVKEEKDSDEVDGKY